MTDLLLVAVFCGTTAAGFIVAVRALPFVNRWVKAAKKPWACDVCMSFWSTGAAALVWSGIVGDYTLLYAAGPAYPVTMWVLRQITAPSSLPELPPLEDSDA